MAVLTFKESREVKFYSAWKYMVMNTRTHTEELRHKILGDFLVYSQPTRDRKWIRSEYTQVNIPLCFLSEIKHYNLWRIFNHSIQVNGRVFYFGITGFFFFFWYRQ